MSDLGEMDRAELAALVIGHPAIDRALHHIAALEAEVGRLNALLQSVAGAKNLSDIARAINRIRGTHQLT